MKRRKVVKKSLTQGLNQPGGAVSQGLNATGSQGAADAQFYVYTTEPANESRFPTFTSHKLRMMAASGMGETLAMEAAVERMSRTQEEDPRLSPTPHVMDIADVTRGLGLERSDEDRVQQLAREYSSGGTPQRLGPQRTSFQTRARLMSTLRTGMRHVPPDTRDEIMRRAQALWTKENASAAGRTPEIRFHLDTTEKSMDGELVFVIDPSEPLSKGIARGGKYYRRVATGKADRPYRYYYTKAEYEKDHGHEAHLHGPEVAEQRVGASAEHYQREADKHHEKASRAADAKTRDYHEERAGRFEALAEKHSVPAPAQQELLFDVSAPPAEPVVTPTAPSEPKTPPAPEPVIEAPSAKAHDIITSWKAPEGVTMERREMGDGSGGYYVTFRIPRGTKKAWAEAHAAGKALRDAIRESGDQSFVWSKKLETTYADYSGPVWGTQHPSSVVSSFRFYPAGSRHAEEVKDPTKKTAREAEESRADAERARERDARSARESKVRDFVEEATNGYADAGVDALREMSRKIEAHPDWTNERTLLDHHRHIEHRILKLESDAKRIKAVDDAIASGDPDRIKHEWRRMTETHWSEFNAQKDALRTAVHDLDAREAEERETHKRNAEEKAKHAEEERERRAREAQPADIVPVVPLDTPPSKPSVFNRPPEGGWKDEHRVPEDRQDPATFGLSDEERSAKRLAIRTETQTRRHRNVRLVFEKGKTITIDGKQWRVHTVGEQVGRYGVRHILEPVGGSKARKPKTLTIWPNGQAALTTNAGAQEEVGHIEGPRVADAPVIVDTPKAPPAPTNAFPTNTTVAPEGTPRAEAKKETAKSADDFVNARASKIRNFGEDIAGSARHKAFVWKNLRQALESSQAADVFTRDVLMKQHPIDLTSRIQSRDTEAHKAASAMAALVGNYVLAKFPGKPTLPRLVPGRGYTGDRFVTHGGTDIEDVSAEEHEKRQRASYYEALQTIRAIVEKNAARDIVDPNGYRSELRAAYDAHRARYGMDAGTDALADVHNGLGSQYRPAATSVAGRAEAFTQKLVQKYGSVQEGFMKSPEHVMRVLDGDSLNAAFDSVEKKDGPKVDLTQVYDTDVMVRRGPATEFRSATQAEETLNKRSGGKYELRGVQWGNSMTDGEREHHLKSILDSARDLTELLGLPPAMFSFNGRLGIGFGARGHGSARAHYEPMKKVINLTRKKGAGSFAHEWGHFFDNIVGEIAYGSGFATQRYAGTANGPRSDPKVTNTMHTLTTSEPYTAFRARVREQAEEMKMKGKEAAYWASSKEVFARTFERYVQEKLRSQGRENSYLVAFRKDNGGNGLWPTDAEVEALTPYFDAVFTAFRQSPMLEKALAMFGGVPLIDPRYQHIVDRLVIPI